MEAGVPSSLSSGDVGGPCSSSSSTTTQEKADALYRGSEILAPMVRASTTPLRILALRYGADVVYTEEIVDRAITGTVRAVNHSLGTIDYVKPRASFSAKVQRRMANDAHHPDGKDGAVLLRIDPSVEAGKLVYQLGTGESSLALSAATMVANDVDGLDVNMGCPKKFSVSGGMGSALLGDQRRACDILSTLRRNIPHKPVSAKIRLLDPTDPRPTVDFARALIGAGACAVAIHARITGDESHVDARWDTLKEVVTKLKSSEGVPIVVNGDLYTRTDILEMKRRTGCDGVMLARPALYNASIFRKGGDANRGGEENGSDESPLSHFQNRRHDGQYGYASSLLLPKTEVVKEYVSLAAKYRAHPKNAKYVVCEMMTNRRAPSNRVPFLTQVYPGGQTVDGVCKCKSLDDLIKLWDVRLHGSSGAAEATGDVHSYDDRYFLDHDRFQRERTGGRQSPAAVAKDEKGGGVEGGRSSSTSAATAEKEDEKKVDVDDFNKDGSDRGGNGPSKRLKV